MLSYAFHSILAFESFCELFLSDLVASRFLCNPQMQVNAFHVLAQSAGESNTRLLDSILGKLAPEVIRQALNQKIRAPNHYFDSFTPLHLACLGGNKLAVRMFLQNGASPREETSDGKTPIALAQEALDSAASQDYRKYVFTDFAAAVRLKDKRACLLEIVEELENWRVN
jgi:hypothetical protein